MEPSVNAVEDGFFRLLSQSGWEYQVVEHPPVYTIEEAMAAVPHLDGMKTKNIFARDAKGNRHFLVVVPHDKRIDLAALAQTLPSTKLSMGSADRLQRHLGVTSGSVSVFALINDARKAVELIVDEEVWSADKVQAHPLRNTATVSITHASLEAFLAYTGHSARVIRVP